MIELSYGGKTAKAQIVDRVSDLTWLESAYIIGHPVHSVVTVPGELLIVPLR